MATDLEPKPRTAVLIDAENISSKHAKTIVEILRQRQGVYQFRAYGSKATCKGWIEKLQQYHPRRTTPLKTGKSNVVDMTLMLDAMVYVLRHGVTHVCIVSNDTDYVPLIRKLKELQCRTTIMGELTASKPLRKSCDDFVLLKQA